MSVFLISTIVVANENNMEQFNNAMAYYKKRNSDFSEIQSYKKFSNLAKLGHARSMVFTYMVFYEFTETLSDKATEAVKFLVEAARRGDHEAQYFLGFIISNGIFVNEDVELANKWLETSSKQGNRQASTLLGINLATEFMSNLTENEKSTLSEIDYKKIKNFLRHAESTNNAAGILALAVVIFFQEQNLEEAKRLSSIAKELGHSDAKEFLNELITLEKKFEK